MKPTIKDIKEENKKSSLLYTYISPSAKKLFEISKVSRQDAKIYDFNSQEDALKINVFLIEKPKYFNFSVVTEAYKTNKNGILYVRKKTNISLIFKNKKLWTTNSSTDGKIRPAGLREVLDYDIIAYAGLTSGEDDYKRLKDRLNTLFDKVPFLNTFKEHKKLNSTLTYNYMVAHKNFSVTDRLTHATGGIKGHKFLEAFDNDISKVESVVNDLFDTRFRKLVQSNIKLIDAEKINPEIFQRSFITTFTDTLRMISVFNQPLKLRWSVKRITQLHDKMAKEITIKAAKLSETLFNIPKEIEKLNLYINQNSPFESVIIDNSKDLVLHGLEQGHCVATYSSNVLSGYSYILYLIDKAKKMWTIQVSNPCSGLRIMQMRGYHNSTPPQEVRGEIETHFNKFNEKGLEAGF